MMKIILSITIIMILLSYTVANMVDERCGHQVGGRTCNNYKCCSQYGYCGSNEKYCSPEKHCQSNCWSGLSRSNVTAYYYPYNARKNKYDFSVVKTTCSSLDAGKPYAWRSKYGWTAFCGPAGPRGEEACGKCLKVTNPSVNNVVVKLRIVDECGDGGFNLDFEMFKKLDTNGVGRQQGHLNVDYQFISCDDKVSGKNDFKNILVSAIDNV